MFFQNLWLIWNKFMKNCSTSNASETNTFLSMLFCFFVLFTKFFKFSRHVGILFLWSAHHHLGWSLHYSDGTGLNRWRSGNVLLHFNQNSNLKLYSKNLATCLPEQGETSDGTLDTDSSNILTGNRILSDFCFGLWKNKS